MAELRNKNRGNHHDAPGCVTPPTVTAMVASDVRRAEKKILSCTMSFGANSIWSWLAVLPTVPVDTQAAPGDKRYLGKIRLVHVNFKLPRHGGSVFSSHQAVRPSCVIVAVPVLNRSMTYGRKSRQPSCGISWAKLLGALPMVNASIALS